MELSEGFVAARAARIGYHLWKHPGKISEANRGGYQIRDLSGPIQAGPHFELSLSEVADFFRLQLHVIDPAQRKPKSLEDWIAEDTRPPMGEEERVNLHKDDTSVSRWIWWKTWFHY
jgi:hypothetical protein